MFHAGECPSQQGRHNRGESLGLQNMSGLAFRTLQQSFAGSNQ